MVNILNSAVNVNSIIQKFWFSRSKKSWVLRVCYNSASATTMIKNTGVMIANKEGYIINEYDHTSFEVFHLKGKI